MNEADYKVRVLEWVREASTEASLPYIAPEFSLVGTSIRADLAVLSEDGFVGVEIKSASDNLRRLPAQLAGYARCFDYTILVVAERHLSGLRDLNLHNAFVWTLADNRALTLHLEGQRNDVRAADVLRLLTQKERERAVRNLSNTRSDFGPPLLTVEKSKQAFQKTFIDRYGDTSDRFWKSVSERSINATDLPILSRFHSRRQEVNAAENQRQEFWKQWVGKVNSQFALA